MASTRLRILVPVKRVIDYAIKPRVNKSQTAVETSGIKHSLNPFDELSIEEAVRIRERSTKTFSPPLPSFVESILALSAGPPKAADVLRTALAMGADRALHILLDEGQVLEPLAVAKLLAEVVRRERINLVLVGKQSIDDDAAQTGPMLAGLLGWPQATQASKVEFEGEEMDLVRVTQEVDGGTSVVRARLPMVVTTDLRLNEPRYASLPNIMRAKKKEMRKGSLEEYGVDPAVRSKMLKVVEPEPRKGGGKVQDVDGMVRRLKELGVL